jgi:hypothetical protein
MGARADELMRDDRERLHGREEAVEAVRVERVRDDRACMCIALTDDLV